MIVYHGSLEKIETPEIRVPNRAMPTSRNTHQQRTPKWYSDLMTMG